jgi:iron complex outermembrane recepter protein
VKSAPFFEHSRLSFRVDNLFDAQQRVTDANGIVPLSYQPGFLDPKGRFIEVSFRKQF